MRDYGDKKEQLKAVKEDTTLELLRLHPTDNAEAYRELEGWAGKRAAKQEEANERDGVPER